MALFNDSIAREITALIHRRYLEFGVMLGESAAHEHTDQMGESSTLQRDLKLLIGIANGEYTRTGELVQQAEQVIRRLTDALLGNALHSRTFIPNDFWKTDIGILVSRVRWWISVDDLITISNAAALAFGENTQANRMRIGRAIENGILEWVPDPSVANSQQNKRVLRPQVEHLRDQRRLPE